MKDTKISDAIFILLPGSCPSGGTLGRWGCPGGKKIQTWPCGISNRRGLRAEQNASKIFILGSNWWPWSEVKRSNIIKFRLPCQFQRFFIPNFLCVFTNKRLKKVRERAKIRNRYNQAPHLTPDTNGKVRYHKREPRALSKQVTTYWTYFSSCCWGGTWGCWGEGSKTLAWGFAMTF